MLASERLLGVADRRKLAMVTCLILRRRRLAHPLNAVDPSITLSHSFCACVIFWGLKNSRRKKTGSRTRFLGASTGRWGFQNGTFRFFRSLRVSTSTKGPSSSTTAGGRSRGTRGAWGSAAMAAWTAATFFASEFTQTRPEPCAA